MTFRGGLTLALVVVACGELRTAPGPSDAGTSNTDGSPGPDAASDPIDAGKPDSGELLLEPQPDAKLGPGPACRSEVGTCVPANTPGLIEVPTEMTLEGALAAAKPGDTIQLRSVSSSASFKVPKDVSLRGCGIAVLGGEVSLAGGNQNVEGLLLSKRLTVSESGMYRVSRSTFDGTADTEAGLLVTTGFTPNVEIALTVEDSKFRARDSGMEIVATTTAGSRGLRVDVKNSTFYRVQHPFVMRRSSGTPIFLASITSSTFHSFVKAVELFDLVPRRRVSPFAPASSTRGSSVFKTRASSA